MSKLLEAFEFDYVRFSDSYFENEENIKKILDNGTTKEELIKQGLIEAIEDVNTSKQRVLENDGVYQDFPHAIDLQITTVYCPDNAYLTNLVELFELLAEPSKKEYLDYVILYDSARFWDNPRLHSRIIAILATDNKYFVNKCDSNGNRKIINSKDRFTGIIPYLFFNGYQNLYKRMIKIAFKVARDYSFFAGKMILSLHNFLKAYDNSNYGLFCGILGDIKSNQKQFLSCDEMLQYSRLYFNINDIIEFKKKSKNEPNLFAANEAIGKYGTWFGNGFGFKEEYKKCSFIDLLE